jgi:integrin beta 3
MIPGLAGPLASGVGRIRGARSELRRQLREQQRVRTIAMAMVVALLLGAPLLYLGIQTATRDPVLNSLAGLPVPSWAAQSPEDRIITGSRWCFIDCRFRERRLVSGATPEETNEVYQNALREAGWTPWEVEGCPLVEVDGFYTCWTRDEYTLDLWVHLPTCAYDPRNMRPELDPDPPGEPSASPGADECSGSLVEIKMQNRVSDERGLTQREPDAPGPGDQPSGPAGTPGPTETSGPARAPTATASTST